MKTIKIDVAYISDIYIDVDKIVLTISDELQTSINKAMELVKDNSFINNITVNCYDTQLFFDGEESDFQVSTELLLISNNGFTYRAYGKYDSIDIVESEFINLKEIS